jgi:uncharacterized protein YdaU (DUF1376 family)
MKPKLCPDWPFIATDWLSSTKVSLMSLAEQGAYLRLLCHAWSDPDCCLPDDDNALALLSHCGEAWSQGSGAKIRQCFIQDQERPGRIYNARQRATRAMQQTRMDTARIQRQNASHARWNKQPKAQPGLQPQSDGNAPALRPDNGSTCGEHPSSPASRHSLQDRAHDAERPSLEEVKVHAHIIGLAAWKAIDWFDEMEAAGWLDFQHRPVNDWKALLRRVTRKWESDGRPSGPPTRRTQSAPSSARNAGIVDTGYAEATRKKMERDNE